MGKNDKQYMECKNPNTYAMNLKHYINMHKSYMIDTIHI